MKVFLDTSAFIAIVHPQGARHLEALAKRDRCAANRHALHTSDAVLYETLNWLAVRLGPRPAAEFGRAVWLRSPYLRILSLDSEDRLGALAVLTKYSQIPLSYVDASNIYLFHKHRLDRIFSYDRHFVSANLPVL